MRPGESEKRMSVRQSLLAILDQGPCYGYQLRSEFDRRAGSTWPLNVGQIYNTLDRLDRDGLVEKGDTDDQGHVYWRITAAGSAEAQAWLARPIDRSGGARDELALKLAVSATLPGADIAEIIRVQREASLARKDELSARYVPMASSSDPDEVLSAVAVSAAMFAAESEVRWLDHVAVRIAALPAGAMTRALSRDQPARGRPRKPVAAVSDAPARAR